MSSAACAVVLIEATDGIARALEVALERHGHRVQRATDLQEALALPDPDVIVSSLPARQSLELFAESQRRGRLARGVLIAPEASKELLTRALELGVREVLCRPVELPALVRAVEAAVTPRAGEIGFALAADHQAVETAARRLLSIAVRCGVGPTARARIASATAELVDNAVRHAYLDGAGEIEVAARIGEREAAVRVRDRGRGFAVCDPWRRDVEDAAPRGLERARALCENLELWSAPGRGSTALLRFGIYRVTFDGGPLLDLTELDYFAPSTAREVLRLLRRAPSPTELSLSPAVAVLVGRLLSARTARAPGLAPMTTP